MKIGIIIPARLQSERLPNKVLRPFLGKVMIEHVWKRANLIQEKAEIVIATDSLEIKKVCETFGANVMLTSNNHQNGLSRTGEVAKILNWDFYIILQADEILIDPKNLELLIKTIKEKNSSPFYNLITNLKKISELDNSSSRFSSLWEISLVSIIILFKISELELISDKDLDLKSPTLH